MAKMVGGLFGGFNGTIGNVVGYQFRGMQIVRSKSEKIQANYSPARVVQMTKFSLVTKFLSPLSQFMNLAHKKNFKTMTAYNKLWSLNMNQIIAGAWPDLRIDYRKVIVTTGSLPRPHEATVACARSGHLVLSWSNDFDCGSARSDDQLYVAVYNEETKTWKVFENIATRIDGSWILDMKAFRCCRLQTYIGFISADGLRVSDSQWLGMINVL
jgi:Family of unknown function (DUF6266)